MTEPVAVEASEARFREGDRLDRAATTPAELAAAVTHLRAAAEAGLAAARTRLGMAYQWGRGVPRDYEAAAHWYRLAANQGDAKAEMLHDLLLEADLVGPDGLWTFYMEAVRRRTLAVAGWPDTLLALGLIDAHGYKEGATVVASQGRVSLAAFMDAFLAHGLVDQAGALRTLRELATAGDATAASRLGVLYALEGLAIAEGDPDAARWLAAAGEQATPVARLARAMGQGLAGDAEAALQVGIFRELGIGCEPDAAAAADWYRRAAEAGSLAALNHLVALAPAYAFDYEAPPEDAPGGGS